jgi:2,3,4,5-tetrahydropyridine-2,6-dicarboxylate N-succinyltransferase
MSTMFAFGVGLATCNGNGDILDAWFARPTKDVDGAVTAAVRTVVRARQQSLTPGELRALGTHLELAGAASLAAGCVQLAELDRPAIAVALEQDDAIRSTPEAYLKLHLLSHRLALPNTLNLDDIFAQLPNVVWTSEGPVDPREMEMRHLRARAEGRHLTVHAIDKFPRMTDYVIPAGVRIADSSRIRLGAYLGEGTTVMHEGFVNFNAAALGPNMVEGRISQGVIVGEHSDLGGSSSTMGTLSGGGSIKISIGRHCLIGANAGTGIPLGDRCTIEAGLYVTSGTLVQVVDEHGMQINTVKARELAGQSDMLFIRNSRTGAVQCRTNRAAIRLNEQLHAHN